ncbi:MAG: ribonuclease III [Planctomycetota bacterium]
MGEPIHRFRDEGLLRLALTHASTGGGADNERLEFLGDAVLDLVVAEELFHHHPQADEGVLTEMKAWVVSREVLSEAARTLSLAGDAILGNGMKGRPLPRSVHANLYEAVLGAIYLDAGLDAARKFARESLQEPLDRVRRLEEVPNPKQDLQRLSQLRTGMPPSYVVLDERGDAHAKAFLVAAEVGDRRFPSAWGRTRKEAERWAAYEALLLLAEAAEPGEAAAT